MPETSCRIALIGDNDIVMHGLRSMLTPVEALIFPMRFHQLEAMSPVDIAIIDVSSKGEADLAIVRDVADCPKVGAVVLFGWDLSDELMRDALRRGCRGVLNKALSGEELVASLDRVQRGEIVISPYHAKVIDDRYTSAVTRELQLVGLSQRESEVIGLITRGYTNLEIAGSCYLSVNTVKYYVRSAYRKIGVERRAQAVRWGIEHGFSFLAEEDDQFMSFA